MHEVKVLILGGGFGGMEAILESSNTGLTDIGEVTIINDGIYFEYLPALPEIISGKVNEEEITVNISSLADKNGVHFINDRVTFINLEEKVISTMRHRIEFDYLIIALGAEPTYFDVKGSEKSYTAYKLADYLKIKEKLSKLNGYDRKKIIIGGAGLTGVEVAGELIDYFKGAGINAEIIVIEKMPNSVPFIGNLKASKLVEEYLSRKGVKFLFNRSIYEITQDYVLLDDGSKLDSDLTIWTAGIKANLLATKLNAERRGRGWIVVDPYMRISGYRSIYAVGDINCAIINGKTAMKMAEEAMLQAKTAIKNIYRDLKGLSPIPHNVKFPIENPKCLISLGGGTAVLAYGKRFAVRGKFAYSLLKKWFVEKRYLKRLKQR